MTTNNSLYNTSVIPCQKTFPSALRITINIISDYFFITLQMIFQKSSEYHQIFVPYGLITSICPLYRRDTHQKPNLLAQINVNYFTGILFRWEWIRLMCGDRCSIDRHVRKVFILPRTGHFFLFQKSPSPWFYIQQVFWFWNLSW